MKISLNWLKEYLPVPIAPTQLAEILTGIGLEVESLDRVERVRGGLEGLLVGRVVDVSPHPGADRLRVTRVDTGKGEILQIVCGAPNVAKDQKVVVAPPGSTIYPLEGPPLTLRVAKIRGVESYGMICAEDELGLGKNHEGILILDQTAVAGSPAKNYFDLPADEIFTIGLTPNRISAMSHIGVAREICTWLNHHQGSSLRPVLPENGPFPKADQETSLEIHIGDPRGCRRYAGVTISGIQVGPSPAWVAERLLSVGIRPINNIVDITNYVLLEYGQPLHAFDLDRIGGKQLLIGKGSKGTLATLDGKERKIDPQDLVISDSHGPLCLAGVSGGLESGIQEGTRNIFLESAWFDPISVRRTSLCLGLRTDAALRFEKGADISLVPTALRRAASLVCSVAGGRISSDFLDYYPSPMQQTSLHVDYAYLDRTGGKHFAPERVLALLRSLEFGIEKEDIQGFTALVPYSFPDINSDCDIAEEVMRFDGLDQIPIPVRISFVPSPEPDETFQQLRERTSDYLSSSGFYEILTPSIVSREKGGPEQEDKRIRLINPLNAEMDELRNSLLPGGLQVIAYNLNRQNYSLLLYEFGKTYQRAETLEESEQLGVWMTGEALENWSGRGLRPDHYLLKGFLTNLLTHLGIGAVGFRENSSGDLEEVQFLESGGQTLGFYGKVASRPVAEAGIRQEVWHGILYWNTICRMAPREGIKSNPPPRFPGVKRDLSLILDRQVRYSELQEMIRELKLPLLRQMELFDVFESEKLGTNRKSYALRFLFRDDARTLTEKDIDGALQKIIGALKGQLNAEIRN